MNHSSINLSKVDFALKGDFSMKRTILMVTVIALALLFGGTGQANAGITVGNWDSGNCYPFACGPTDGLTEYQEIFNAAAFPGKITINSFAIARDPNYGTGMDQGTYQVSFSTTSAPMGGLSSNLASNIGSDNTLFGTYNLQGPMPNTTTFNGNSFTYDPTKGNLLMDVIITNGVKVGGYEGFYKADYTGIQVQRAWNSSLYGTYVNQTGALQVTFNPSNVVPEPSSLTVLGIGVFGLAGFGWRKRKQTAAIA